LTVQVRADDWAAAQRRLAFLHAVIVQILRDEARLREWFSAAELAALRLPGLPRSKGGVARIAAAQHWPRRSVTGRGGERFEYHVYALPERAFSALLDRIVTAPPCVDDPAPLRPETPAPESEPLEVGPNMAPPWMLPLMRLVKGGGAHTVDDLVRDLPGALPRGAAMPSRAQVQDALTSLGLPSP
jgi:hypothetical protein